MVTWLLQSPMAGIHDCTCDSSAVLIQLMDLDPFFALLLVDVDHIVVWTQRNL